MVPDGGVAAVGERAGAPVAYSGGVVRVPAEYPRRDLGHEAAVVVPDAVPYHVVAHLGRRRRRGLPSFLRCCSPAAGGAARDAVGRRRGAAGERDGEAL